MHPLMHYLDSFLNLQGMNYKLVPDAHLAALSMEHGLVMVPADSDFRLFTGLRIEDPTV
jgi:predicted nucleic acid-binding protein